MRLNEITPGTVTQAWLHPLPWKMQTVLLSALRGCDGQSKEDPSKQVTRALRGVLLHDASPGVGSFMTPSELGGAVARMVADMDKYPLHFITHLAHACEIVGHKHPDMETRVRWGRVYLMIVDAMHLEPEAEALLDARLRDQLPGGRP